MTQPFDFQAAREASLMASQAQEASEDDLRAAAKDYARKENLYRVALARKIVELRADGMSITLAGDIARGTPDIAELKFERDLADGMLKAAEQAAWRHAADRKDLLRFIGWSERASFLDTREPSDDALVFGKPAA